MAQPAIEFANFGDAAKFFYRNFSANAPSRFGRYLGAAGGREIEAAAKYIWNLELSESLLPSLHAAELALKNSVHLSMAQIYGPSSTACFPDGRQADSRWWFDASIRGMPLLRQRDREKVEAAYFKVKRKGAPITERVVAELSFGFWVELLNSEYDEVIVVPVLGTTMRGVQRNRPSNRTQGWLRRTFGAFRDLRNRVSHLEPVLDFPDLDLTQSLAWEVAQDIFPWFAQALWPSCRFSTVIAKGWGPAEELLKQRIRTELYEPFRKRSE